MALNAKTDPTYVPKRINGKFAPGVSGVPGGSLEATRRSFNKDFLLALAADFKQHGASAIEKVRKQQPAAYMKICALLVPREMRVEHTGGVKSMTDEEPTGDRGCPGGSRRRAGGWQPRKIARRAPERWQPRAHRGRARAGGAAGPIAKAQRRLERRPRLLPCFPTSRARADE